VVLLHFPDIITRAAYEDSLSGEAKSLHTQVR
jgi:hypothetical protein